MKQQKQTGNFHAFYSFCLSGFGTGLHTAAGCCWVEAARVLRLPDIELIFEEVVLIRRILCNPCREHEDKPGTDTLYDKLCWRAAEIHEEIAKIDGIAQLRSASEFHLRKHAPHLLPFPTR